MLDLDALNAALDSTCQDDDAPDDYTEVDGPEDFDPEPHLTLAKAICP